MIAWTDIDLELKRDYLGTVTNFFWNALLNQLFISSLTAVDQFHSYDNIIPNTLYVCDFLIWCFCSFPWGAIIENY